MTSPPDYEGSFTLLEIAVVIGIVAILAILAIPIISSIRARGQRVQCTANLKNLSVGANLYVQEHGVWPQIRPVGSGGAPEDFANAWVAALEPFSVPRKTWICPTIQNLLRNPDYLAPENARIDYIATPFDDKPTSPHEWPRQPWFIETGSVHGNGNLIIFTDGSVSDLKTAVQSASSGP